jgi:hypothetical protein
MPALEERLRPSGKVSVLILDAKKVPTWESFEALVGKRRRLDAKLMQELVDGRIAQSWSRQKNLIVNSGLTALAGELTNQSGAPFILNYCAVGSGTTAPASTDTTLTTEIGRVLVTAPYVVSPNYAVWDSFFGSGACNGTWNESGLLTASSGGTLGCHALFSSSFPKSSSNTAVVEWKWAL